MSDSTYRGTTPRPADFDAFWDARMAEADAVPLCYAVEPSEIPAYPTCEYLNLWFTGMGGARIYAKYLRPKSDKPLPLVLQFHGYPAQAEAGWNNPRSRAWVTLCWRWTAPVRAAKARISAASSARQFPAI